jgi:hypothetical protein
MAFLRRVGRSGIVQQQRIRLEDRGLCPVRSLSHSLISNAEAGSSPPESHVSTWKYLSEFRSKSPIQTGSSFRTVASR